MKVLVWGLGYVGSVTAACLAQAGHQVVGIEPNISKVEMLNAGSSPVKEPGVTRLVSDTIKKKRLRAVQDPRGLVAWADISLICVGTPSNADGSTELTYLENVAEDIGRELRASPRSHFHTVVLRSTVFPGITRDLLLPLIEECSRRKAGEGFGLVMNPEFLREASALQDFYTPPYTVIGQFDVRSGKMTASLYENVDAPVHYTTLEEAELLKLLNNAFHALKIGFANEVGRLSEVLNIDSHRVMDLVCADTKLNISTAYLQPGFAFGGSCLPKDLRTLTYNARRLGLTLPIVDGILPSNELQVELAHIKIQQKKAKRVAILGLSFKSWTDDLRESPMIKLIRLLWQDGVEVLVYDPDVCLDDMLGSNLNYLERHLPQIHDIFHSSDEAVLADTQVVVVGKNRPEFRELVSRLSSDTFVLDLVRMPTVPPASGYYEGIGW